MTNYSYYKDKDDDETFSVTILGEKYDLVSMFDKIVAWNSIYEIDKIGLSDLTLVPDLMQHVNIRDINNYPEIMWDNIVDVFLLLKHYLGYIKMDEWVAEARNKSEKLDFFLRHIYK